MITILMHCIAQQATTQSQGNDIHSNKNINSYGIQAYEDITSHEQEED